MTVFAVGNISSISATPHPNFKKNLCLSSQEKGVGEGSIVRIVGWLAPSAKIHQSNGAMVPWCIFACAQCTLLTTNNKRPISRLPLPTAKTVGSISGRRTTKRWLFGYRSGDGCHTGSSPAQAGQAVAKRMVVPWVTFLLSARPLTQILRKICASPPNKKGWERLYISNFLSFTSPLGEASEALREWVRGLKKPRRAGPGVFNFNNFNPLSAGAPAHQYGGS